MNIVLFFQSTYQKSWRDKLAGVYRYARKADWQVQVIAEESGFIPVRKLLALWRPIGCLVDRALAGGNNPVAAFGKTPVVFLDQDPRKIRGKFFGVTHDSAATAHRAAEELLAFECAHYGFVGWERPFFWSKERQAAFSDVVRSKGKSISVLVENREDLSRVDFLKVLSDWLVSLPRPCGVFAVNDIVAEQVQAACQILRLNVPGDVAIVGVDNDELICENANPTLTSVLPDFEKAGWLLAELLDRRIRNPKLKTTHETYGPLMVVRRQSTRRFQRTDMRVMHALDYIRCTPCMDLRLEDVIQAMGCSRRLADLRFREVTGHSLLDEIHNVRISKAFELLRKTNQSIGAIAALCGYEGESFLKKLFKKRMGVSMREWRKRNLL